MALRILDRAPAIEVMDRPPRRRRRRSRLPFSPWHLLLMPVALAFLFPLVQMVLTALTPSEEMNRFPPPLFPTRPTVQGFVDLFATAPVGRWLLNSVVVSTISVLAHLVLCSMAGYGFARLKFGGRTVGFFFVVATIMIPIQLLMTPTYVMFARLHLVDTLAAAFVPWLASAFGIFLMRQFFLSLPAELEEAARIDGCTSWGVFWRIVLPLAKPALATLAVFTLLGAWNDLVWPLIAISNEQWYTIQLGLANFQGTRHTQWTLLMAGNVVATLPMIAFFVLAQRQFVATMTFSGLKG